MALATDDSLARKARTIARLRAEDVPVHEGLPPVDGEAGTRLRPREDVAWRIVCLLVVAERARGLDLAEVGSLVERYRLAGRFTPAEAAFLGNAAPSEHATSQFVWRYEAAWVLLWALGYVDELSRPEQVSDPARSAAFVVERGMERFIDEAGMRPVAEVLDAVDLVYRYHWALRQAQGQGDPVPAGLSPDVVLERHHALNWLRADEPWDAVRTDT